MRQWALILACPISATRHREERGQLWHKLADYHSFVARWLAGPLGLARKGALARSLGAIFYWPTESCSTYQVNLEAGWLAVRAPIEQVERSGSAHSRRLINWLATGARGQPAEPPGAGMAARARQNKRQTGN